MGLKAKRRQKKKSLGVARLAIFFFFFFSSVQRGVRDCACKGAPRGSPLSPFDPFFYAPLSYFLFFFRHPLSRSDPRARDCLPQSSSSSSSIYSPFPLIFFLEYFKSRALYIPLFFRTKGPFTPSSTHSLAALLSSPQHQIYLSLSAYKLWMLVKCLFFSFSRVCDRFTFWNWENSL